MGEEASSIVCSEMLDKAVMKNFTLLLFYPLVMLFGREAFGNSCRVADRFTWSFSTEMGAWITDVIEVTKSFLIRGSIPKMVPQIAQDTALFNSVIKQGRQLSRRRCAPNDPR